MANDTNKFDPNEEEYRASDAETPSVFTAAPAAGPSKTNVFERLKRKNIMIAIGVIVVVFVIYKVIDVAYTPSTSHNRMAPPIQPAPQMVVTPPTTQPVTQMPVAAAAVENRITTLEQQGNNYQAGIDKLNSQMTDVQNTLTSLNSKLADVTTALQTLSSQFAEQQERIKMQEAAKHARLTRHRTVPKPIYYVRALVPGRAWLATKSGGTVTVGLGDNLPGYGIVQAIDANQGTITTSTGAIIGYNPGDR